jgi:adenylate cyclase
MVRRVFFYRLYIVFNIAVIWVLFSLLFLYNIVEVDKAILEKRSLSFFSLGFAITGFIVAGAEAFYLKNAFHRFPLWLSTIMKMGLTFLLFLVISVVFLLAYFVLRYNGSFHQFEDVFLHKVLLTRSFLIFIIDLGVLSFLSILMLEITDKYGPGGIRDLLLGHYNNPRNENRIFVFLDMNESTTIAEKIGHEKYFNMLKDFFADITEPIVANGAHIYQYVGDEVVLCWKNTPANKIKCLDFVKQADRALKRRQKYYLERYGAFPSFKTGIHAGEVTAGYIGIIKKDLVFSGDTLNTAARITSKCHELNHLFLLSAEFLYGLKDPNGYKIEEIGEMELKGRKEKEKLYSLSFE